MKPKTLGLAVVIALIGVAFAQAQTPNTAKDTPSATQATPESTQSDVPDPATGPGGADNRLATQSPGQLCRSQASAKKLTGDDRTNFIKKCKAAKTP
jgi:hypothetical protein